MNFFKKLLGSIIPALREDGGSLEKRAIVERYREIEQSAELKEYLELDELVESEDFVQKKYNWENKDFKMTETYELANRYKELLNNAELQAFLEIEQSKRLKDFLAFKASPDYAKLKDEDEVSKSEELQKMAMFEQSKDYEIYLDYVDSKLPKEFKELGDKLNTPEFRQEYAFWSNPNRWKATEEYQKVIRYKQLSKRADIVFYLEHDPKEIERMEKELKASKK